MKKPKNSNYCCNVVEIQNIIPIENCDNIVHTKIFGNYVIVGKDTKIGDIGLYFPPETKLQHLFLAANNLFRKKELNADKEQSGFFEENGRIKTIKLRGNKSMGFFCPISFLDYINHKEKLSVGDEFDEIGGVEICWKFVKKTRQQGVSKSEKKILKSKLVSGQFRFHDDTGQLGKNMHKFPFGTRTDITYKLHGTSLIAGKLLTKKKLGIGSRILNWLGFDIKTEEYETIYSSRRVIKNGHVGGFYGDVDIWGLAAKRLETALIPGMTMYAEVVGFLPNGAPIQKKYDYGCESGEFEVYVYRITMTNVTGESFDFSNSQIRRWCLETNIKPVPHLVFSQVTDPPNEWMDYIYDNLVAGNCFMCKNKVPSEGVVIRDESNPIWEVFKLKSFEFYQHETKLLDKGEEDIEEQG